MSYVRDRRVQFFRATVSVNAVADAWVFNGLPAAYKVLNFWVCNPSTSLGASLATLGLYTATAAGGTAVVTAVVLTTLTAAGSDPVLMTLASNSRRTDASIFACCTVAHGSAATVDILLEVLDLS